MASLIARLRGAVAPALVLALLPRTASAQYDCNSNDPSKWPPSSKPYFMLAIDTSGSMTSCTDSAHAGSDTCASGAVNNSCSLEPTRINDAKCAVRKTVQAFAGQVNFGMMTYARILSGCSSGVAPDGCSAANADNCGGDHYAGNNCQLNNFTNAVGNAGCGNQPDCSAANASIFNGTVINGSSTPPIIGGGTLTMTGGGSVSGDNWINGGNVVVDMLQDPTWAPATTPNTNVGLLLEWVDNRTDNSHEIWADGYTPLEGILRTAHQYYAAGWSSAWADGNYCATGGPTIDHPSPLNAAQDRACRSLNIILVTDGQEFCNGTPANAAQALYKVGTVIQGVRVPIRTFVIGFAGVAAADVDPIADMGDDGTANTSTTALIANNEVQLSQALSRIISGSVAPESCNNVDDNCNSCVDEGFKKYCDRNKTGRSIAYLSNAANNPGSDDCCNGTRGTATTAGTCLYNFAQSITPANPKGNQYWLPCWDPATDNVNPETKWLCSDPGESCDNVDNNCETTITPASLATNTADEGFNKCPQCPVAETCNNLDDNCDGFIDNAPNSTVPYSVTPTCKVCTPTAEVCDGCDNDCDGDIDEGASGAPCGPSDPPQCLGTKPCVATTAPGGYLQSIGQPVGGCLNPATPKYGACSASGTAETCNGIDDNCDGFVDNNPSGTGGTCKPTAGSPTIGACKAGKFICENGALVCDGYVGPTTEICDGIDNDCDGLTDAADPDMVGAGGVCGSTVGQCQKGTYACVAGVMTCQTTAPPQPEICNGLDDDCNGLTDDGNLGDAPTDFGCWTSQSATCTQTCGFAGKTWCPPAGATCTGLGTLVGACKAGGLICEGPNGWVCRGDQGPKPEECNGLDDDCNGKDDDGTLGPPINEVCGKTVPDSPCKEGVWQCVAGVRVCSGTGPQTETCNDYDDDCDTVKDNGVGVGGPCSLPPDPRFPGDRSQGTCAPGTLKCDGAGNTVCQGGKGPEPEICDGLDNDCDGVTDETGAAPDGVDGTADPKDPSKVIGAACGADAGVCEPGKYGCMQARVVCQGGIIAVNAETCDCKDNNCNGQIDEDLPNKPVCSTGKVCVNLAPGVCQCAQPCAGGEFGCPGGQTCNYTLTRSGTTTVQNLGVCVPGANACGDCSKKTVTRPDGTVACAPAGSQSNSSRPIPECVCKGLSGCREPCYNASQCPTGQSCSPLDGKCRDSNNCFFFGCAAGQTCSGSGVCGTNPCDPNPCTGSTPVCRPSADLTTHVCVGSCAGVNCTKAGEVCVDGECTPNGCGQTCAAGTFCAPGANDAGTGTCVSNQCPSPRCDDGRFCEPATGRCIDDPCGGVVCPGNQTCQNGQCDFPPAPPPDGGNAGGGGSTSTDSGTPVGGGGSSGTGTKTKSVFGLATGGGGCACSVPKQRSDHAGLLAGLGVALALGTRRRRRRDATAAKGGAR